MFIVKGLLSTVLCVALTPVLIAEERDKLVDVNILYTAPDAGGSDDFHTSKILTVNYNQYLKSWLAASAGLFVSEEMLERSKQDIVGSYQAGIEMRGLTLTLRPEYEFSNRNRVYARGGLVVYTARLNVEEYFATGLPAGTTSDDTSGYGHLLTLGWAHNFTPAVSFQFELGNMTLLGLFDGESPNAFDLSNTGFSIGLGYAF